MVTRAGIGDFPIGFRRGWSPWQRDLRRLLEYASAEQYAFVDFGPSPAEEIEQVMAAGVAVGSVDLLAWKELLSPAEDRRWDAVAKNIAHLRSVASLGVKRFLAALSPEDPTRPRPANLASAVESYRALGDVAGELGVKIVLEGAPGPPPHFPTLGCTPADLRAFFAATACDAIGVNFDPSHLIRMGIDAVRFIREFHSRIHHAHAKDTLLSEDDRYDHGNLQSATFAAPHRFGGNVWRYAIPGTGNVPWMPILLTLKETGYQGGLSIELEDERFNGSEEVERSGLSQSREFLAGNS